MDNTEIIKFDDIGFILNAKYDAYGFLISGIDCGSFSGSFEFDYDSLMITEIYLHGHEKVDSRNVWQDTELSQMDPLYSRLAAELERQCGSKIDHATPDHLLARNEQNEDALRTISFDGVRTC